jgi:hypothetical protein
VPRPQGAAFFLCAVRIAAIGSNGTHKSQRFLNSFALVAESFVIRPFVKHTRAAGNFFDMKMTVRAGAVALAMFGLLSNPYFSQAADIGAAAGSLQMAASINIDRVKSVLRLTPEQERYWVPVEAALRDLARRQAQDETAGLARRIGRRVVSVVLNAAAVERLVVAARPLIAVLDQEQRRAAIDLAREMGLGPVVAALN